MKKLKTIVNERIRYLEKRKSLKEGEENELNILRELNPLRSEKEILEVLSAKITHFYDVMNSGTCAKDSKELESASKAMYALFNFKVRVFAENNDSESKRRKSVDCNVVPTERIKLRYVGEKETNINMASMTNWMISQKIAIKQE